MRRHLRRTTFLAPVLVLGLVLSACSEQSESEEEREREEQEAAGVEGACEGAPIDAADLALPADFPLLDGLVVTTSGESGPSATADGWFDADLSRAYDAFHTSLESAGYRITFDEQERDDAEITYESSDESSTGIVELRVRCGTEERVAVHITNRPA